MNVLRACLFALLGLMLGANVQAQNAGSETVLDTLFIKLREASDPTAIQSLEAAIWEQWAMVPDMGQRALMMRGIAEMQQHDLKTSIQWSASRAARKSRAAASGDKRPSRA